MENNNEYKKRTGETVAAHALRILAPIPESKWIVDKFTDEKERCCALGHYMRLKSENVNDYSLWNCKDHDNCDLRLLSKDFLSSKGYENIDISYINNCEYIEVYIEYDDPTPKQRVLHLLNDMVKAGY